jgi:hypothetical protein
LRNKRLVEINQLGVDRAVEMKFVGAPSMAPTAANLGNSTNSAAATAAGDKPGETGGSKRETL